MSKQVEQNKLGNIASRGRDKAPNREKTEAERTGKIDGRSRRKLSNDEQILMRTNKRYRTLIEDIANQNGWTYSETLERCVDLMVEKLHGRSA